MAAILSKDDLLIADAPRYAEKGCTGQDKDNGLGPGRLAKGPESSRESLGRLVARIPGSWLFPVPKVNRFRIMLLLREHGPPPPAFLRPLVKPVAVAPCAE